MGSLATARGCRRPARRSRQQDATAAEKKVWCPPPTSAGTSRRARIHCPIAATTRFKFAPCRRPAGSVEEVDDAARPPVASGGARAVGAAAAVVGEDTRCSAYQAPRARIFLVIRTQVAWLDRPQPCAPEMEGYVEQEELLRESRTHAVRDCN